MKYLIRPAGQGTYAVYRSPSGEVVTGGWDQSRALRWASELNRGAGIEFDAAKELARVQRKRDEAVCVTVDG